VERLPLSAFHLAGLLESSQRAAICHAESEKKKKKSVGTKQTEEDFAIAPETVTPTLDTSKWPLLLKVRSGPAQSFRFWPGRFALLSELRQNARPNGALHADPDGLLPAETTHI